MSRAEYRKPAPRVELCIVKILLKAMRKESWKENENEHMRTVITEKKPKMQAREDVKEREIENHNKLHYNQKD